MVEKILEAKNVNIPQKSFEEITVEEASGLVKKVESFEAIIKAKEIEIRELNKKLVEKNTQSPNTNFIETVLEVKKLVLELDENKTNSPIKKDDFQIDKNLLNRNFASIKNLINSIT
jgi:hypothetical protein